MKFNQGILRPHQDYLDYYNKIEVCPVVWRGKDIQSSSQEHHGTTRGSLALALPGNLGESEILPGISMAVQEMEIGECTGLHRHSWLHLYIVLSAENASVVLGEESNQTAYHLDKGDVFLIPAMCPHRFDNQEGTDRLVMMRMQDLPNLARLGSLIHEEYSDRD